MFDDNRIQMREHLAQTVCVVWRYRHRVLQLTKASIWRVAAAAAAVFRLNAPMRPR